VLSGKERRAGTPWALLGACALSACATAGGGDGSDGGPGGSVGSGARPAGAASPGGSAGAGAAGGADSSGGGGDAATDGGTPASSGAATHGGAEAGAPDDRPFADVTAVVARATDGGFTFSVSVMSADIDCTQYADFWEVVTEDGTLRYRRILEHSHTDENGTTDADAPGNTFTREGGPVPVAGDEVVVVRAHLSNGGYHGRVMRGSALAGFLPAPDVGDDFAPELQTADPQPAECLF